MRPKMVKIIPKMVKMRPWSITKVGYLKFLGSLRWGT